MQKKWSLVLDLLHCCLLIVMSSITLCNIIVVIIIITYVIIIIIITYAGWATATGTNVPANRRTRGATAGRTARKAARTAARKRTKEKPKEIAPKTRNSSESKNCQNGLILKLMNEFWNETYTNMRFLLNYVLNTNIRIKVTEMIHRMKFNFCISELYFEGVTMWFIRDPLTTFNIYYIDISVSTQSHVSLRMLG